MPDFPSGSDGKESASNARDLSSVPGSRRSPGEANGNPLQYACLGNPMDRGAWWVTVHGGPKESDTTEHTHTHTHTHTQATTSISIHEVWFVNKRTQRAKGIRPSPKAQEPGELLFKGKKKKCLSHFKQRANSCFLHPIFLCRPPTGQCLSTLGGQSSLLPTNSSVNLFQKHPYQLSSVHFSHSVVSNSLQFREPQHPRPPCKLPEST